MLRFQPIHLASNPVLFPLHCPGWYDFRRLKKYQLEPMGKPKHCFLTTQIEPLELVKPFARLHLQHDKEISSSLTKITHSPLPCDSLRPMVYYVLQCSYWMKLWLLSFVLLWEVSLQCSHSPSASIREPNALNHECLWHLNTPQD